MSEKGPARVQTLAALLLAVVAILAYVIPATRLGLYQRWPVVSYALGVASIVWLVLLLRRRVTVWRVAALVLSVALLALFVAWTAAFSVYEQRPPRLATGTELAAELGSLRLAGHDGAEHPVLARGDGRGTLLVFYRGFW